MARATTSGTPYARLAINGLVTEFRRCEPPRTHINGILDINVTLSLRDSIQHTDTRKAHRIMNTDTLKRESRLLNGTNLPHQSLLISPRGDLAHRGITERRLILFRAYVVGTWPGMQRHYVAIVLSTTPTIRLVKYIQKWAASDAT